MRRLVLVVSLVSLLTGCASAAPTAPQTTAPLRTATLLTQTQTPTPTSLASASAEVLSSIATIEVGDSFFIPSQIIVTVGTTVPWVNRGPQAHTATARDGSFGSPDMEFGNTYRYTFTKPGRYEYYCEQHTDMFGEVDVR